MGENRLAVLDAVAFKMFIICVVVVVNLVIGQTSGSGPVVGTDYGSVRGLSLINYQGEYVVP